MVLVSAEGVRNVPVIEGSGRGYVRAALHVLGVYSAGRAAHIGAHDCAAGCADTRRDILSVTAADLVAEYAAYDASNNGARDIDAAAGIYNLALHPAALLRRPHNGTHGSNGSLVEGLALPTPEVIDARRSRGSEALSFVGLALRFRGSDLRRVGLDARISRSALRGECRLLATNARYILRRGDTLAGNYGQRVHVVVPPGTGSKVVGLAEAGCRLLELDGCVCHDLRIVSRRV
jgi:hypothetical protein